MSTTLNSLQSLSEELTGLVARSVSGVVAVKARSHRTVSGIAIREDLVAVTAGAVRGDGPVTVHGVGGNSGTGTLLGRDPRVHTAFLKVEGLQLRPIESTGSQDLKPGTLAVVVGLTTDAGPSASIAMLGAVGGARRTWRGGTLDPFIRLDVNIYPSQTGAAVIDSEGKLIGLAHPGLLQYSAVAIPAAMLQRSAEEILASGQIRQGYLGVGLQPVRIPAALRGKISSEQEAGLIVLNVESGSPAEQAGVQLGDILISFDAQRLSDVEDLQAVLRGEAVGRPARVVFVRGGEVQEAQIRVGERTGRSR
jgi:S1-C subfamily serine protease